MNRAISPTGMANCSLNGQVKPWNGYIWTEDQAAVSSLKSLCCRAFTDLAVGSEWHKIVPIAPYTYEDLRNDLNQLLTTFDKITLDPHANNLNTRNAARLDWEQRASTLFYQGFVKIV